MGSKPRIPDPDYVARVVVEKQRAIYWVCALLERDSGETRRGARRALAELGYDAGRVESLLALGEPTSGAREAVGFGDRWSRGDGARPRA